MNLHAYCPLTARLRSVKPAKQVALNAAQRPGAAIPFFKLLCVD